MTSLNQEQLFETGKIAIGETLNELPQLRVSSGQQNGINFSLGNAGLSLLDLRGLGTQRTLVLVNGRRQVGSDIYNTASAVDINTIPTALIERVDVVTGGDSAVYGSDAIAGVVNFILKKNFSGIDVRGQAGISQYNDANAYFASITGGQNFAGGRGNIVLSAEYGQQDQYFGNVRPTLKTQNAFLTVDTDPSGTPNGSDGTPDRLFFTNVKSATTGNQGLVVFYLGRANATFNCGVDPVGTFYNCPYKFQTDGTLVPVTGTRTGIGPNGSFVGGNGDGFREGDQLQLASNLKRYTINLLTHYDVSDAFAPFLDAKYARTDIVGAGNSGPAFIISGGNGGDVRQMFRLDNPFLSSQARTLITNTLLTSGFGTGTIGSAGQTLTAADITAINNGSYRVRLAESFLNFPKRQQFTDRETFEVGGGARGTFNGDWNYEVSANYGEFHEHQLLKGNYNRQRFVLAMDSTRDSAGNIVCRSKIDLTAATQLAGATIGQNFTAAQRAAILAADVAACVPLNPFGGVYTPDMVNYIVQDTASHGKITQFVANGFVTGDTSGFLNLPGGPIGFAVGAEYRRETTEYHVDPIISGGYTFFNSVADIVGAPAFEVKEAFGEVRLPLLKDVPFFKSLELSGAARYASYKGATGGVWSYNAGGEWTPVAGLRFRGNYSRAVRAPTTAELYSATVPGFATVNDPCSLNFRGQGSSFRAANCLAAGVPANFNFLYPGSITVRNGGNPDLQAENSDSYTFGAVVQPRFIPGLSISADYYNITVNKVITGVAAQTILNLCVDQPTIVGNPFCSLFQRNPGPGNGPAGEEPGRILEGSLLISTLNYAALRDRGIDFEVNYRRRLGNLGVLDTTLDWTHLIQRSQYTDPSNPSFENVVMGELGDPKDKGRLRANLKHGAVDLTYTMEYIGRMYLNTFEDYNSVNGLPPQNADFASIKFYPAVFYHSARVGMDLSKHYKAYVGVDNIFGKLPPYGLTGIGFGSGIYDNRGRFYYAGVRANF